MRWLRLLTFHPKTAWDLQIRSFENSSTFLGQDMHFKSPWMMALSFSTPTGKKASTKDYSNLIIFTYSKCSKKCVAVEPSLFHCGCIYLWRPILNYRIHFMELSVGKSVNINDSDDIDDNNMKVHSITDHRIFWFERDAQGSSSPTLEWMADVRIEPTILVLLAPCSMYTHPKKIFSSGEGHTFYTGICLTSEN